MARYDLLKAVGSLARNITKWTRLDDHKLHRLMCYINSTLHIRMVGWVGDDSTAMMNPVLFADAGFEGCLKTSKSTSGSFVALRGPDTRFPIAAASKTENVVSHSTPEAEIFAADHSIRTHGAPY